MPEETKEMPKSVEIPAPEGTQKITPHFPPKKETGKAFREAGYFKLEERDAWRKIIEEKVKNFKGEKEARAALQKEVNQYIRGLIRAKGDEDKELAAGGELTAAVEAYREKFEEGSVGWKALNNFYQLLERRGVSRLAETAKKPPGRSFSELREQLEGAREQLRTGFPGEPDYNAAREKLAGLEEEMDERTNGQYHLLRELREDLAAGRAIGDQLKELKKEAVELSKKKGKEEEGRFMREEISRLEEVVQGEERRPIKRPHLRLDSWMTAEGDLARPEVVQPREWEQGIPKYGRFENINQVVFAVRRQLNDAIMRNGWIRPDDDEDLAIRGWLQQAEDLAKEAGGRNTVQWRIYKDLEDEYQAVRGMLIWWHDGVMSHEEPAAVGFEQMTRRGLDFNDERIKWIFNGYRRREFRHSLARKCPMLEVAPSQEKLRELGRDFREGNFNPGATPNERLAAMLRLGTALGIKDGAEDKVRRIRLQDVDQIWVLENPVTLNPNLSPSDIRGEAEEGTGYIYEMYRIFNLDAYGMKYIFTRHANVFYALEYSHSALISRSHPTQTITIEELLRLPVRKRIEFGWKSTQSNRENLRNLTDRQVPVYINHLNQKMTGFYTMWQEMAMAPFWHANLDHLTDVRKQELGWDTSLSEEENRMQLQNLALYEEIRSALENERAKYDWDPSLRTEENWKRIRERTPEKERKYELLKRNLINLRIGDISSDEWENMDFKEAFPKATTLNNWGMHLGYMQETMKDIVDIIRGIDVREKIFHLGTGEMMRYVPDELAFIKERERIHWSDALSRSMLYAFRTYREKGNRHNLAVTIRKEIPSGFYRGFLRKFDFLACGIRGIDWAEYPSRMIERGQEHLALRQFFQRLSEIKIVREGILRNELLKRARVTYEDLVRFAGLRINREKLHFDLIPFGEALNGPKDLDVLEDYLAIPEEYRGKLLELLGNAFRSYQLAERLKEGGEMNRAAEAEERERGDKGLKEGREYIDKLTARWKERKRVAVKARVTWERVRGKEKIKFRVPDEVKKRLIKRLVPRNDEDLLDWYQKIKSIHFKEELETEVDFSVLREYLSISSEEERREWLRDNFDQEHLSGSKTEKICQVWAEFEEMSEQRRLTWESNNRHKALAIRDFLAGWPGRTGWNRSEQGELIMAVWSAIDKYLAPHYEKNPNLKRKFFGLWYDIWERETRLFKIMRRQKASMDFRAKDEKRWKVDAQGNQIQAPEDVIVGQYIHDQLEWDEEFPELIKYERESVWNEEKFTFQRNKLRGIDRLANLMMGTGEYWPGDPREVSPLYYGHKTDRLIRRFFARQSIGYRLKQSILAARRLGIEIKDYWEDYRADREVMTPQKMTAILTGLYSQGTISDFEELTELLQPYGCTEAEWQFFRDERRAARVRDIEDKAEAGVEAEFRGSMDKVLTQMAGPAPAGLGGLVNMVLGGQTGRERGRILRNTALGFGLPIGINVAGMTFGWSILGIPGLGPLLAIPSGLGGLYFSIDRGDQQRGMHWLMSRVLGTLMKEREDRRDPYVIKRGYTVPWWLGGNRLLEKVAENPILRLFLIPAVWDDWVDGAAVIQAVAKSKAELGSESSEK